VPLFDSFDQTAVCAEVLAGVTTRLKIHRRRCAEAAGDPFLLATDLADHLVERGVPFRAAHHAVGQVVALSEARGVALPELATTEVRRIHPGFGRDWAKVFDLSRALKRRTGPGMPGPAQVARQFARWKKLLQA
jgi:argininosuccinate lyase